MLSPSFSSLTERFLFHFAQTHQKAAIGFWMHAGKSYCNFNGMGIDNDEYVTSILYFSGFQCMGQ
jgi:hypothetical protein